MELAAWLDVALEGGVRELEQARADHRALRKLLTGDWRLRARRVAELAERLRTAHCKVDAAIDRARRRAKADPAAAPGSKLADLVEEERAAVQTLLTQARGEAAELGTQLDWLCAASLEESYFASSRAWFARERNAWTALFISLIALLPLAVWFVASDGGALKVIFSDEGLAEPVVWVSALGLGLALLVSWVRLFHFGWLGVRVPALLQPTVLSVLVGVLSAFAVLSFALKTPAPLAEALGVSMALGVWQVLAALWRVPSDTEP